MMTPQPRHHALAAMLAALRPLTLPLPRRPPPIRPLPPPFLTLVLVARLFGPGLTETTTVRPSPPLAPGNYF